MIRALFQISTEQENIPTGAARRRAACYGTGQKWSRERPGHRHVVRELPTGQNEEGLAPDHDVRVVGVVIDLSGLSQCLDILSHLHHLFVGV